MKKSLSVLGTITLIGTSTTSLISCNTEYTKTQLQELKEKNNIKTKDGILEWIAPQENIFNKVDNKYFFVMWRGNKNDSWEINKFKNDTYLLDGQNKNIELKNNFQLYLYKAPNFPIDLVINKINNPVAITQWRTDKNKSYFKFVYHWYSDKNIPNLVVDYKIGEIKVEDE